jgi:hypothetical protein
MDKLIYYLICFTEIGLKLAWISNFPCFHSLYPQFIAGVRVPDSFIALDMQAILEISLSLGLLLTPRGNAGDRAHCHLFLMHCQHSAQSGLQPVFPAGGELCQLPANNAVSSRGARTHIKDSWMANKALNRNAFSRSHVLASRKCSLREEFPSRYFINSGFIMWERQQACRI